MPSCLLGVGNSGISLEELLFSIASNQPGFKKYIEVLCEVSYAFGLHNAL